MKKLWRKNPRGISLIEVLVATAVFLLFALAIYGAINLVFKIVYSSRLRILETAILSEQLEVVRNLPFNDVGILNGVPSGVLPYSTSTVRNGITFNIITTVRNIDDPFDGTVTTTPQDTSPADYKLVEMSIICAQCKQTKPVLLSTRVSPKGLEGASTNGSIFIHVFDADGLDVQGASVNVVFNGTPALNINDTTDNSGMVRIIDTPTGTQAYDITVSKSGYSSDYTVSTSLDVLNPDKPPSNVASQYVTEISFSIDQLASLNINTINQSCVAIGSANFNIRGFKTIGHNPTVYKLDQDLVTNGSGLYSFSTIEWDEYYLSTSGTIYDIAGSIPIHPFDITPGLAQDSYLVLKAHTPNSIWVTVRDAATQQPLSNASVRLSGNGYDQTIQADVGYLSQTDWSGGSGQDSYTDETRYYSDNSNLDVTGSAGNIKLKKIGGNYLTSGILESSTFDFGSSPTYRNFMWSPYSQPAGTSIKFQIASSNSSTPTSWDFVGPDGTNLTYYTSTSTLIDSNHKGDQYLRYKVYLETTDNKKTPTLSDILITYTNDCTPPGQVFFSGLSAGTYTLETSKSGYGTNTASDIEIGGNEEAIVDLSISG